jgi:soluble lytic murein transglycosylase-like protein
MIKRIVSTAVVTAVILGGAMALAMPTAETEGSPSSRMNIRAIREEPLPIPATAKVPQWWTLAREVGWAEKDLPILDRVIWRESKGQADAFNPDDPNGGSLCLLQINRFWVKYLRQNGIINRANDLFDPSTCLRAGLAIHRYGMERYGWGWGPWAIYP